MRAPLLLLAASLHFALPSRAAPPLLEIPHGQLGIPGNRVLPNFLLGLSLTYADAGAAYRGEYSAGTEYDGYFNPRMCYRYARNGYFSISKPADALRACGGDSFSGSLLNWASMSKLDLLRLALTGGDRAIDERGQTVLQRAWLPDGAFHPDFYAHPVRFPRKSITDPKAVTPYGGGAVYITSCRNRIVFGRAVTGASCDSEAAKNLGAFDVRVQVCEKADSQSRPALCVKYKGGFKPEGAIQENSGRMRIGVMGYLTDFGKEDRNLYGAALRAPLSSGAEWDSETGILGTGGAINYINLMGRSAPGRAGAYKAGDPGAELFYESLRYLQGRAPSPGVPAVASDDGLAVWNSREDPRTASCQAASIAMIGHASFELDRYVPGNSESAREDAARPSDRFNGTFDVMAATRRVGELEGLDRLDLRGDGPDGAGSYYLAGAAWWAHSNAVRKDSSLGVATLALELEVPAKQASPLYLASKYGSSTGLFSGADPRAIAPAVRQLLAAGRYPHGEIPAQAVAGRSYVVQASYDRANSSGTLRRYGLSAGTAASSTAPDWDAAQAMPAAEERKIYTLADDGTTVEFRHDALPETEGLDKDTVDYLRGARTREIGQPNGVFRRRTGILGDIVHSVPMLVGAPSASVQAADYAKFYAAASKRRSAVYVGANDGMLHAFDADTGAEMFAYVPNALLPALHELTRPGYIHRAYVDGSPGHGEALVNGKWRTVLVSGMGTGARGVFALDITDPSHFGSGLGALWEFTERDDPSIGHVRSAPQIAKFQVGTKSGQPVFRHFAVVASGFNNYEAKASADAARGALFLLSLDKPTGDPWELDVNYYKLVTPISDAGKANALAPPGFALSANGSVRYAYAGDLQGNLWRFDFSGKPSSWQKAVGPGNKNAPLFVARDAAGRRQPISHAPRVVYAPGSGYIVLFGTGSFIENADADPASFGPQSFYGIRDSTRKPAVLVAGRDDLVQRVLAGQGPYTVTGEALLFEGANARKGWYFDYPNARQQGERAAATPLLASGTLIADTLSPGTDACKAPTVRTYVVDAVSGLAYTTDGNAASGQQTGDIVRSEVYLSALMLDLGMVADTREPTGGAMATRTVGIVRMGVRGKLEAPLQVKVKVPTRRVSWREVANWQELHEKARRPGRKGK
ncbi:MAG: pilus assembly protein [Telluria sp.]